MARIGIIGTGWGARVQVPAFREAGLQVVCIAGHDSARTDRIASELGLTAFSNWRDLVASDIDLVTIVTPPSEHLSMAEAALSEGKHVLSEKPTAMNAGEAERMLAVAREHPGQLALIDHELRFLPAWIEAKRLLGDLGPIRFIEMRYCSGSRADRNRAWNWWSDAKHGGGVLGAIGSHLVDAVRYLAGEIESVQATLSTFVSERPDGEEWRPVTSVDFAALHCRLSSGATAAITASVVATSDEPTTITIHATHGGIRLVDESLLLARPGKPFELAHGESLANRPGNSSGGAFGSGTLHLGHALRRALDEGDGSALAPAASFEDGLAQQRILDAARRSAGSGTLTPVER
jgi:predicted dehydrogenase